MHKPLRISPKLMAVSVAGLFALAVLLLTASAVPATDRIVFFDVFERYFVTWSPPSVTTTIAPGETQTIPLSLTTHRQLRNVVVYIPPALRPFVQVAPEEFPLIVKDTTVNLNLTLSAPADTLPGTIEGTLRLFSAMRLGGFRILFLPIFFAKPLPVTVSVVEPALGIVGTPTVRPLFIVATELTPVPIEISIPDPGLISGSVNLERLDAIGKVIEELGVLHDDGLAGDIIAGDKVFTLQTSLNEPTAGQVRLHVSAAFQGLLRRVTSVAAILQVNPIIDPEQVLAQFISHLQVGDVELAVLGLSKSADAAKIRALDATTRMRLADSLANAHLLEAQRTLRIYEGQWPDENGQPREVKFFLSREAQGDWKIRF